MNKLIKYFNQNRKKILLIVLIIVLLIILTRVLNYFARLNAQEENNRLFSQNIDRDTSIPDEAIVSGTEITEEEAKEDKEIIDTFVQACNNKDYNTAFNLLTEDCKNNIFNGSANNFMNGYASVVFETEKTYKLEGWLEKNYLTYKITYYEDNILETGGITEGLNYTDYITVINENNEQKLSIGGFIEEIPMAYKENTNNIELEVTSGKVYMNYTTYTINVKNNTDKEILLTDSSNNKEICLVDSNDSEYISYLNEIPQYDLTIKSGEQKKLNIRFNKMYSSNVNIRRITFKNIYSDYEKYKNGEETEKIKVDIEI